MATETNKAENAVAYAALILVDESIDITPEKLQTLIKAAGIEDVEPIWTTLFAKALEAKDIKNILTTVTAAAPKSGATVDEIAVEGDAKQAAGEGDKSDDDGDKLVDSDDEDEGLMGLFD